MNAATRASAPMCTGRTVAIRKTTNKIEIKTSCTDTGVPRGWSRRVGHPPVKRFRDTEPPFR
ncbi:hypothetical protein GCM10023328_03000 [Modestobacter marinus]